MQDTIPRAIFELIFGWNATPTVWASPTRSVGRLAMAHWRLMCYCTSTAPMAVKKLSTAGEAPLGFLGENPSETEKCSPESSPGGSKSQDCVACSLPIALHAHFQLLAAKHLVLKLSCTLFASLQGWSSYFIFFLFSFLQDEKDPGKGQTKMISVSYLLQRRRDAF